MAAKRAVQLGHRRRNSRLFGPLLGAPAPKLMPRSQRSPARTGARRDFLLGSWPSEWARAAPVESRRLSALLLTAAIVRTLVGWRHFESWSRLAPPSKPIGSLANQNIPPPTPPPTPPSDWPGSYGSSLMTAFRERAQEAGICFATLESMPPNAEEAKYDELIEAIEKHSNARVVVCMCEGRTVGKLFDGLKRHKIQNEYLVVGR